MTEQSITVSVETMQDLLDALRHITEQYKLERAFKRAECQNATSPKEHMDIVDEEMERLENVCCVQDVRQAQQHIKYYADQQALTFYKL